MNRKNNIAALFLIGFGIFYGYLSTQLPTRTMPNSPDPSFFPLVLTAILLFLSFALLYQGFKPSKGKVIQEKKTDLTRPAAGLGAFFLYIVVLQWLGFLLVSVPFFVGMLIIYGERRKLWWVAFSLGIPLFLFVVFRYLFQISLPPAGLFD